MRRTSLAVTVALLTAAASVPLDPPAAAQAASVAALRIDTHHPGLPYPSGTIGLSTEAWELKGHLNVRNRNLVRLMRLLGPSVLRVGGNSVDLSWWTSDGEGAPAWATSTVTPADLRALGGLLRASGWRVLLGVDLGHFEPARAADEARHAQRILGARLLGIEIGNEPDDFGKRPGLRPPTYGAAEYLSEAAAYRRAVSAAAPGVGVYGPALAQTEWLAQLGPGAGLFAGLTQHFYPTNTCPGAGPGGSTLEPTASELLSPTVRQREEQLLSVLTRAGRALGKPVRIAETNTAACSGSRYSSPTFASALWALDWALRSAQSGVAGIDFHAGTGPCGTRSESPICVPGRGGGALRAQPEYYGMLAARLLEGGRFLSCSLGGAQAQPGLTAWATLAPDGTVRLAIDDMASGGPSRYLSISATGYRSVAELALNAPALGARAGTTLGGAAIDGQAQWHPAAGGWRAAPGALRVVVRPASALLLTLKPRRALRRAARRPPLSGARAVRRPPGRDRWTARRSAASRRRSRGW